MFEILSCTFRQSTTFSVLVLLSDVPLPKLVTLEGSMCYLPSSHLPNRDILYTYLIACDHILKVLGVHLWFLSANALMSDEWWWGGFSTATNVFTIPSLSGSHDQVPNHLCFHYFTLVWLIGLCFIDEERILYLDSHFKVRNVIKNPCNFHSPLWWYLKGLYLKPTVLSF